MSREMYEQPKVMLLGDAALLTQGGGIGGCTDAGVDQVQCLESLVCQLDPTQPGC